MKNTKSEILEQAESVVKRLVLQYHEYLSLSDEIDRLKTGKLKLTATLSKAHGKSIAGIAAHERDYPETYRMSGSSCTQRA